MAPIEPAITLDADMPAGAALQRLARHGLWLDAQHPAAQACLAPLIARLGLSADEAERRLARDPRRHQAVLRRQWDDRVLWYTLPARALLEACAAAPPSQALLDLLQLHETDSGPTVDVAQLEGRPAARAVVLDGDEPIGVIAPAPRVTTAVRAARGAPPRTGAAAPPDEAMPRPAMPPSPPPVPFTGSSTGSSTADPSTADALPGAPAATAPVQAWPHVDAPEVVEAGLAFEVVIGLAVARQPGVSGGPMALPTADATTVLDFTIELIAHGLDAPQGWSRPLRLPLADLASARARFQLIGRPPAGPQPMTLTTLEVRYLRQGSVCGTASRPLVISASGMPAARPFGQPWAAQPATASAVGWAPDADAPDLTLEIVKPDRNAARGGFVCRLYSPHALQADAGPHDIELGDDAKTFAKGLVEQVRQYSGNLLIESTLEAAGRTVAQCLPAAFFDALGEVAARTAPAPPAVLIVSAEPYVPWELAWLDAPIDAARPAFLGAQALVGRWLREPGAARATPPRPDVQPRARLPGRHMAVMAGNYQAASGLRPLPKARDEAQTLVARLAAQPLDASPAAVKQLLDAQLDPGVEAVHFAGHGEFDPHQPDSAAVFLDDGSPLRSMLFRAARYGGERQPLLFLNACMVGIGGELLGDMGGYPGNCLRGGFGAVLGALWEVDDTVAHDLALEFWQRAWPAATPAARGEPVAAILRDLRAKYLTAPTPNAPPVATYLAYVFYGHPRLTLSAAG